MVMDRTRPIPIGSEIIVCGSGGHLSFQTTDRVEDPRDSRVVDVSRYGPATSAQPDHAAWAHPPGVCTQNDEDGGWEDEDPTPVLPVPHPSDPPVPGPAPPAGESPYRPPFPRPCDPCHARKKGCDVDSRWPCTRCETGGRNCVRTRADEATPRAAGRGRRRGRGRGRSGGPGVRGGHVTRVDRASGRGATRGGSFDRGGKFYSAPGSGDERDGSVERGEPSRKKAKGAHGE